MSRRIGYKEDLSKGKMLRFEDNLPKLPVPDLQGMAFEETILQREYQLMRLLIE
jgi:hypothetical protein